MNIGWKFKFTSMWHRAIASYLRAVAAILTTLTVGGVITDKIDLSFFASLGLSLVGAVIPPLTVFITEAADLLDSDTKN